MNKRLIILTALIICSFTFSMLTLPEVQASSTTQTFLAPASDGYVYVENANYYDAHDALTGTVDSGGNYKSEDNTSFTNTSMESFVQSLTSTLQPYQMTLNSKRNPKPLHSNRRYTTDFSITVQSSTNSIRITQFKQATTIMATIQRKAVAEAQAK